MGGAQGGALVAEAAADVDEEDGVVGAIEGAGGRQVDDGEPGGLAGELGAHVALESAEEVRPRGEPFEDGEGGRVADVPGCLEGRVEEAGYAGECWVDCVVAERGLGVGMGVVRRVELDDVLCRKPSTNSVRGIWLFVPFGYKHRAL